MLRDNILPMCIAISLTGHAIIFMGASNRFHVEVEEKIMPEITYARPDPLPKEKERAVKIEEPVRKAPKPPAKKAINKAAVKPVENKANEDIKDKDIYIDKTSLAEKGEAFISYNKLIKEKIKECLAYPVRYPKGDVYLSFTISRDGVLKDAEISGEPSSSDRILRKASLDAVRGASPFPPFPEELTQKEIRFNLGISFRDNAR
ncbi:MAG: hypothetical protein AUJ75_02045 [Candidatus Omnitrophica bacterium CG1_02_49_10]|nr:MAG: hypothetical protein AUJ75_02045 [Candidatus Omnitrophica bacterium CG1_02_49_10]